MLEKNLVRTAAAKLGVGTERIFGLAPEWAEKPQPRKWVRDQYTRWQYEGKINLFLEEIILDFVLDVLSGRVERSEIPHDTQRA